MSEFTGRKEQQIDWKSLSDDSLRRIVRGLYIEFEKFMHDVRPMIERNDKINTLLERQLQEFAMLNAVERMGEYQDQSEH